MKFQTLFQLQLHAQLSVVQYTVVLVNIVAGDKKLQPNQPISDFPKFRNNSRNILFMKF